MKSLQFIYNAVPSSAFKLARFQKIDTYSLADMIELFGSDNYDIECQQCGCVFQTQDTRRKYCSDECRTKREAEKAKENYHLEKRQKFGNLFCKSCSKRIIGRVRKFCDPVCRKEYYDKSGYHKRRRQEEKKLNESGKFDLYCVYCGTQLTGSQRKFCSKDHANLYMTKTGYWRRTHAR